MQNREELIKYWAGQFKPGDLFVTLTYESKHTPKSAEQAKAMLDCFIKKIQAANHTTAIVAATYECGDRTHHHVLVNDMPIDEIWWAWTGGNIKVLRLDRSYQYSVLVKFMMEHRAKEKTGDEAPISQILTIG